jgi:hypothetical protein
MRLRFTLIRYSSVFWRRPSLRPLAAHGADDTWQEDAQDHEEEHECPKEDTAGDGIL